MVATQEAGRRLLGDWVAVPAADLRFVANLARRLQNGARNDPAMSDLDREFRVRMGSGTFEALGWLLGATDITAVMCEFSTDRSLAGIESQLEEAIGINSVLDPTSAEAAYVAGAVDGLAFAVGMRSRFWWVPLAEPFRTIDGQRDEYGRTV
ncbi:MAG: hypothetical protein ACRCYU_11315 [Nocardioides sp.]